jgi:4-hydroxybenzoate polyprenyltransferase
VIEYLGHFGLWAGLYVTGAYVFFWQLAAAGAPGSWPPVAAIVAVAVAATSVYAIDRIKLSDRLIDPADLAAQPDRYAFLTRNSRRIRSMAFAGVGVAAAVAWLASPLLSAVVLVSVVGVIVYAPGPRRSIPRPKDLLGLKNVWVGMGVVMLTIVATALLGPIGRAGPGEFWATVQARLLPVSEAAVLLLIRVILDAAICDIDDAETDRAHGTRTLANTIGRRRTLLVAVAVRVALCGAIILISPAMWSTRIAWAGAGTIAALGLLMLRDRDLRDTVDASFALEAIVATGVIAGWDSV